MKIQRFYPFCFVLCLQFFFSVLSYSQNESFYITLLQKCLGGETEKTIEGGRIDLLNNEYAIEVEFASKWKQSIGQSLWYGLKTNRKPGIILVLKDKDEYHYAIRLGSTLEYGGLGEKITVWIYPNDFKSCMEYEERAKIEQKEKLEVKTELGNEKCCWLTISTNKRHNRNCSRFQNSKGRFCNKSEGVSCKQCGG